MAECSAKNLGAAPALGLQGAAPSELRNTNRAQARTSAQFRDGLIILWSLVQVQHALPGWIKKVRYLLDSGLFAFSVSVAAWLPFEGGNRSPRFRD